MPPKTRGCTTDDVRSEVSRGFAHSLLLQLLPGRHLPLTLPLALLDRAVDHGLVPEHVALPVDRQAARRNARPPQPPTITHPRARVVAGPAAAVWDVVAPVEARDGVGVDDHQLDHEVEAVEARLGVVPRWVGGGPRGGEADANAEAGAEGEDGGREEQKPDLGALAALAEFLRAVVHARRGDGHERDGDREEGEGGEKGAREELDVPVDAAGAHVQGEEGFNGGGNDHYQESGHAKVQKPEGPAQPARPPEARVVRPNEALREDEVHDEEEEHPGLDEDVGRDGDVHAAGAGSPDDAQDKRHGTCHAEAEQHSREDELVVPLVVDPEDGQVRRGARDEQEQQACTDRVVEGDGGMPAQQGRRGCIGRPRLWCLKAESRSVLKMELQRGRLWCPPSPEGFVRPLLALLERRGGWLISLVYGC